jgi:NADH-quinone oxidoreductase subunit L
MSLSSLAFTAWLLPLGVAALLMVAGPLRRSGRPAAILSVIGAGAALASAIWILLQIGLGLSTTVAETTTIPWLPSDGAVMGTLGVHIDGISATMLVVVTTVAFCVQLFSLEYMAQEPREGLGRYYTWQSLFLFSMVGLVLAPTMLQLFLSWELVGLCSYLLIGFWYTKPSAARAALKAFWTTKLADIGFIVALIIQYTSSHSFAWDASGAEALQGATVFGAAALPVVALGFFIGAMGKSAQWPLHIWLPDAMEGPTPVSALLHAATMVAAGVYLVVRAWPIFEQAEGVLLFVGILGGVTAFSAAATAVVQTDIKKVLAYSTVSQLGYMMAALGAGALMGGYFHLTTHAFFKALLFLGAGSIIHAVHTQELDEMGGLLKKMPLTSGAFIIGTLALAGIPVFSGFFSKDLILESVLHAAQHDSPLYWIPLVLLVAGVALTAFYMGRVLFLAFFGEPSEKVAHAHESGVPVLVSLGILAVLATVAGFGGAWLAGLYGVEHYSFHITPIGVTGLLLALGGLGLAWLIYGRGQLQALPAAMVPLGDFIRAGWVDRSFLFLYRVVMRSLSDFIGWFDRYVIDGLMNLSGWIALEGGDRFRRLQTGQVGDYLYAVLIGVIVFAAFSQVLS